MKQFLFNNLKNIPGWRTNRKLVVFAVDDYGNVRLNSLQARQKLDVRIHNRFDAYDSLETREDLEQLYEVLSSVKDQQGRFACFTPFTLPCNLDFEALAANGYQEYVYETLPTTYEKLSAQQPSAYEGTWNLWQEGIQAGLLSPQFHGREHLNIQHFLHLLKEKNPTLMDSLRHRSLVALSPSRHAPVGWTASFSFWEPAELKKHSPILWEGLDAFEQVFGYRARVFTPPAQKFHPSLYPVLRQKGIIAIDRPFHYQQHMGFGNYKHMFETMRWDAKIGIVKIVRNVVFEPTDSHIDHVGKVLNQIKAAFRWNRPAIISSHRVNFCGHIDPENRKKGLWDLKELLRQIVQRWPDVEFVSVGELAEMMGVGTKNQAEQE